MRKLLVFLVLFCGLVWFDNAYSAENNDDAVELKKIVVTASRSEEEVNKIPQNITVISKKDIEKSNAQTISDVIRNEAGLVVRDWVGNGKTVNVDIRGFGETSSSNTLVLVDGRRVNNVDLSGTDWLQIPLSAVERIEVLRGAGSVLYGDNAVGGVVNIITKKPAEKPALTFQSKMGSYQMYDNQLEVSGKKDKFSAFLLGDYFTTDGFRNNSELLKKDFQGKFGFDLNKTFNSLLSLGYHKDDYGLPGALTDGQLNARGPTGSIYPHDEGNTEDYYANMLLKSDFGTKGVFETNISIRERSSNFDNDYGGQYLSENHIVTFGFTPKYTFDTNILDRGNKLILGLDYYDTENNIMSGYALQANDKIKISKAEAGYYILDKISILNNLILTAGYRHENVKYNFEQLTILQRSEARQLSDDVYTSGLSFIYGNNSCLYLNYSTSFRYPATDEFYTAAYEAWWGGTGGGLNIGLSTQTSDNYEIGIKHNFNNNFNVNFDFFRINMDNEIYYNAITWENLNYPKTFHQGIELSSELRIFDIVRLFTNYSCTNAEFVKGDFAGNKMPLVPVHKWSFGIEVEPIKNLTLNLITSYMDERFEASDLNNSFARMPDYYLLDFNASYKIKEHMKVFFGANNLTDQEYSEYGVINTARTERAFYPSAGRNFMGGVKLTF